jgi:uncharacterized repeat protein (TIGR01451 family)
MRLLPLIALAILALTGSALAQSSPSAGPSNVIGGGGTNTEATCPTRLAAEVKCNPDGTYTLTTSGAGFDGTDISLTSQTNGITIVPQQQPSAATMTWTLTGATPGQVITLVANATKRGGGSVEGTDSCCSTEIEIRIPDCPKPVDVKIEKNGGTTPAPQVGIYDFNIKVTNVGGAFTGANAAVVTDVVPAGMVFNGASGTGWSCTPGTIPAGGTLTCTYTGSGPTAPGQALGGLITINASALGSAPFPPYTNCATAGFTSQSGLVDANTLDNTSCVTVRKPGVVPPPTCPDGLVLQNGACVKPIQPQACAPPVVQGAAPGACVCPMGTVQQGRDCVKTQQQQACMAPMIQGPAPGVCVCPTGTVQQGRDCVKTQQQQACIAPMVQGAAPGVCVCPTGTVQEGRECVTQHTAPAIPFPFPRGGNILGGGQSGGGTRQGTGQGGATPGAGK